MGELPQKAVGFRIKDGVVSQNQEINYYRPFLLTNMYSI